MSDHLSYRDRVVIVTGSSTGLGSAIAIETARRGARAVIVNYSRNRADAETTAQKVESEGAQALIVQGDVAVDADCRRIASAANEFGRIDALFNNAGKTLFAAHDNLDAVTGEDFLDIYRVNVVGAYQMIRASRNLLEAGPNPGAVVNVGSVAGVFGHGSSVPYAASKGALNTLTLSLARALAPKIRVNAICPGYIDTPWYAQNPLGQQALQDRATRIAALKVASGADDIAVSAVFLGSQDSRHMTGETLIVDAGAHLVRPA